MITETCSICPYSDRINGRRKIFTCSGSKGQERKSLVSLERTGEWTVGRAAECLNHLVQCDGAECRQAARSRSCGKLTNVCVCVLASGHIVCRDIPSTLSGSHIALLMDAVQNKLCAFLLSEAWKHSGFCLHALGRGDSESKAKERLWQR